MVKQNRTQLTDLGGENSLDDDLVSAPVPDGVDGQPEDQAGPGQLRIIRRQHDFEPALLGATARPELVAGVAGVNDGGVSQSQRVSPLHLIVASHLAHQPPPPPPPHTHTQIYIYLFENTGERVFA